VPTGVWWLGGKLGGNSQIGWPPNLAAGGRFPKVTAFDERCRDIGCLLSPARPAALIERDEPKRPPGTEHSASVGANAQSLRPFTLDSPGFVTPRSRLTDPRRQKMDWTAE
jgi:hypothetical protein